MNSMNKIPYKIKKCPIEEAIMEIRFSSNFPSEAVFGVFYPIINSLFKDAELIQLPILQLPEAVRVKDPDLVFNPHHSFQKDNLAISLGPRTICFSNRKPYIGWTAWKNIIGNIVGQLLNAEVFKNIESCGLRYINLFNNEIFAVSNINISLTGHNLHSESTSFRTEIIDNDVLKIIQISNNVKMLSDSEQFYGSIIDIDCISNIQMTSDEFSNQYNDILTKLHKKEKEQFFSLLNDDFILQLEPVYKEQ